MLSRLRQLLFVEKVKIDETTDRTRNNPYLLSEDERLQANQAKERTRRLLSDALKKKESLLVEDPNEFGDLEMTCLFITTDLVEELIRELEKVTFAKNTNPEHDIKTVAYVYRGSKDRTIYLCALFWNKDLESRSQEDTIIHEVSHFLGYGHTVQENSERVQKSPQSRLCPLTAYTASSALTFFMGHSGTYTNGSYSCCGETSRDTVCEESMTAFTLRLFRARKEEEDKFFFSLYMKSLYLMMKMDTDFLELDKEAKATKGIMTKYMK